MKLLFLSLFSFWVFTALGQSTFNSFPAAAPVIYLDFDGEEVNSPLWNMGAPIVCQPAALSAAQQQEVFLRVAEDFRPFEINVTTSKATFEAAPIQQRIRVIVTPTSNWFLGVGGVAYVGSFTWGDDTPCFVFSDRLDNSTKMIAECCSHETGHALGLSHQSSYNNECILTATYNAGQGEGETSWAPVMGNSYHKNMTSWNNGPTPFGCQNNQDNLSIITTQNGFGYRLDDCPDDINNNPVVINLNGNLEHEGVITTSNDKDAYRFMLERNSNFRLSATPSSVGLQADGANLDIKLSLYSANRELVGVYNPVQSMSADIDTVLNQGQYYLVVEGTANQYSTDYGSLGAYHLKIINTVLPVCNISFTGVGNAGKHQFNWAVFCEERLLNATLEASANGRDYQAVYQLTGLGGQLSLLPPFSQAQFYRVKVTTYSGRIVFSEIVQIRDGATGESAYLASTLVQNQVTLQAAYPGQFLLQGTNGQVLQKGTMIKGFNYIDVSRLPNGLYLLQLLGNKRETIRIVKQ